MNPVVSEHSEISDANGNQPRSKKNKSGSNRNGKESKGGKLSAGFALMHGFSADNISKNRITVRSSDSFFAMPGFNGKN